MKNKLRLFGIAALAAALAFTFTACEGPRGPMGPAGTPAEIPSIGASGYWYIGGNRTLARAEVLQPTIGESGYWYIGASRTPVRAQGADGDTPEINNGYWYIDGNRLGRAEWVQPTINNGFWYIGSQRIGQATGPQGPPGPPGQNAPIPVRQSVSTEEGIAIGGRVQSNAGHYTLTVQVGQTTFIVANRTAFNRTLPMAWGNENYTVAAVRQVLSGDVYRDRVGAPLPAPTTPLEIATANATTAARTVALEGATLAAIGAAAAAAAEAVEDATAAQRITAATAGAAAAAAQRTAISGVPTWAYVGRDAELASRAALEALAETPTGVQFTAQRASAAAAAATATVQNLPAGTSLANVQAAIIIAAQGVEGITAAQVTTAVTNATTPGMFALLSDPVTALEISGLTIGTSEITFNAGNDRNGNAMTATVMVNVVAASAPDPNRADIIVVGLGSAGTFAALAPARVWPGVRVIAVEMHYLTNDALSRSMGGGHGASVPFNPGARINFTNGLPMVHADGNVSVTYGTMNFVPQTFPVTAAQLPFNTLAANAFGNVVVRDYGIRTRFTSATVGHLPKVQNLREAVAHSNWLRTVFMTELGVLPAGATGMTWGGGAHGTGGMMGQWQFEQLWNDPARSHLTQHIDRRMSHRAVELIQPGGPGSRVEGVIVHAVDPLTGYNQGPQIRLYADMVIMATGNFLRNAELIEEFNEQFINHENLGVFTAQDWLTSGAARGNCGIGFRMALDAGVDPIPEMHFGFGGSTYFCESFIWRLPADANNDLRGVFLSRHFMGALGEPRLTMGAASGGLMVVDGSGNRFANETQALAPNAGGINLMTHPNFVGPPFHVIISSDDNPELTWNSVTTWALGGTAPQRSAHIMDALNAAANITGGRAGLQVLRADTLAGLAEQMFPASTPNFDGSGQGHLVARDNFLATVNAYQAGLATHGNPNYYFDGDDFPNLPARAADLSVRQFRDGLAGDGPFFAVKIYPATSMGHGGVGANWRGRALTQWNNPYSYMENLYVVGEMTFRGLYNITYVAGSGIGWSWSRGMIAAKDAAFRLFWNSEVPSLQARN